MGAENKKRNKYISLPLEGHNCEIDKLLLFTVQWDQGSDRDIIRVPLADGVKEAAAVHIPPTFLVIKSYTSKRPPACLLNHLCIKFNMAERVTNCFWLSSIQVQLINSNDSKSHNGAKYTFVCGDDHQCWHMKSFHRPLGRKKETPRYARRNLQDKHCHFGAEAAETWFRKMA